MQDKRNFGKYIAEKRKEKGLTQEELASKLYVIPTTISKWERGVSYPDITVITNLCKELNISEHEYFTACDDEELTREKRELQKYRTLKEWLFNIINLGYLIGAITCLICNLVIDHKLSWFLVVLLGILISFTITSLPFYLKKNKYRFLKVSFIVTMLVYLLLFTINYVYNGDWLFQSFIIATFEFILVWLGIAICTFTKIDKYYKISIILLLLSICTAFTGTVCEKIFNISSQSDNDFNVIIAILIIIVAIGISIRKILVKRIFK